MAVRYSPGFFAVFFLVSLNNENLCIFWSAGLKAEIFLQFFSLSIMLNYNQVDESSIRIAVFAFMLFNIRAVCMGRVIDYNELWKLAVRRRFSSDFLEEDAGCIWDKRADYYDRSVRDNRKNALEDISFLDLRPQDTVLDVGAGTGRLTVPIAEKVKSVTAVDPSARMLMYLRDNMAEAGLSNCRYVQKRWEDVCLKRDMMPHDVVISAFSMGFYDAAWALDKLHRASKRDIYIFWFAKMRHDDALLEFIEECMGKKHMKKPRYPDYICLLNILHDMGIYADVKIIEHKQTESFISPEDAVSKALLNRRITHDQKEHAYQFYRESLKPDGSEGFVLNSVLSQALIYWNHETQNYKSTFV